MTLEERQKILQSRLAAAQGNKVQIQNALERQTQEIERIIGALQTIQELLNERQPNTPGDDVAPGQPIGHNSSDPNVVE